MNELRLNQYVPIIKGEEGYIIGGNGLFSVDRGSVAVLDEKQEALLQALLRGETRTEEELRSGFGEQQFTFFAARGLFVSGNTDTESIYSRNQAYYYFNNMGNVQKKLSGSSVLILGCGGIGTHVAWNMCVLGVGKITLVDFDTVEESNLNRQILYSMDDIGKNKAEVLRERLQRINPNITVNVLNRKIWSEEELDEIVQSDRFSLILKSLDSPALFPLWLDHVCKRRRIPYISGITVSTAPMIGPTFLPGHSADYSEFFEVNAQTYQHVSGVSQSLGVVMYHIASEISLVAFRLLTGKGSLKYVDCIYTEDVINGKEMILYPKKSKLRTQEQERPVLNMAVWILMLLIVLTAVLTNCIPVMFLNYIICLASPFLIYRTREKTARAALTNIIVFFPVYAAVMLIKTPLFHAHGLLEICSIGISVFTVFSFMIVFSQLIVNILYRKQK